MYALWKLLLRRLNLLAVDAWSTSRPGQPLSLSETKSGHNDDAIRPGLVVERCGQ